MKDYFMNVMFGIFDVGGGQIILILALVLIFFGARKLPELARGLGQGIKEFKKATRDVTDEIQHSMDENHYPPPPRRLDQPQPKPAETVSAEKPSPVPQSADQKS